LDGIAGSATTPDGGVMSVFSTSREIAASPEQVFDAFTSPQRLARWWGPAGFTNTFEICEFKPGGNWSYVMYGPDGKHFRNQSVFEEIVPSSKVVVRHVSKPEHRLTITLVPSNGGTNVRWVQEFEDAETARRVERIVVPANEQNLDRLSVEVVRQ
jgi:uncharacterized protein YndB with AHSA1/START domain